jgi:hypothetical protein
MALALNYLPSYILETIGRALLHTILYRSGRAHATVSSGKVENTISYISLEVEKCTLDLTYVERFSQKRSRLRSNNVRTAVIFLEKFLGRFAETKNVRRKNLERRRAGINV